MLTGRDPFRTTAAHRAGGIVAVEFGLVLLVFATFLTFVGEFYRLSLVDQALARATQLGATAAGSDPDRCADAARRAFAGDRLAQWLLDLDGDGGIGFVVGAGPDGSGGQEVRMDIAADDGVIATGVDFTTPLCGVAGSWIRVRVVVPVRMRFGAGTILRRYDGWALNQA